MLLYIVWDPMKEIIRGIQPPVWYSVLFALGFIISYQLVTHFFKTEGKKTENVDTLTVLCVSDLLRTGSRHSYHTNVVIVL